jgi:hypothetical protein
VRFEIENLDDAMRIADCARRLYLTGRFRDGRTPDAKHLGEKVLRQLDSVALRPLGGLDQPPAEPRFHVMQGIAGSRDPGLRQQQLVVPNAEIGDWFANRHRLSHLGRAYPAGSITEIE